MYALYSAGSLISFFCCVVGCCAPVPADCAPAPVAGCAPCAGAAVCGSDCWAKPAVANTSTSVTSDFFIMAPQNYRESGTGQQGCGTEFAELARMGTPTHAAGPGTANLSASPDPAVVRRQE